MFFISGNNVVEKNAMAFANLEALADEEASDGAKEINCIKGVTLSCTVGDEDKILVDSWVEDKDPTQITSM